MPLFEKKMIPLGALLDTRPEDLKKKDYLADEIFVAGAVAPFTHERIKQLTATVYNQWGTSSCVPHGFLTQLEYEGIAPANLNISRLRAYRKRVNYPGAGSIAADMYDQIRSGQSNDFGTPVSCTEAIANAMSLVKGSKIFKDFNYYTFTDYKKVAAAVASGKAVSVFIYATTKEWSREYVEILSPNLQIGQAEVSHCVTLIPNGDFTEDGREYFSVQDSAPFGARHLRYMPHDFFLKRAFYAGQVFPKGELPPAPPLPALQLPTLPCALGDRGAAVSSLQKYLIDKGFLEAQYLTGLYGPLTAKAVLWFQLFNHTKFTSNIPKLLEWNGENWGKQSIDLITNNS